MRGEGMKQRLFLLLVAGIVCAAETSGDFPIIHQAVDGSGTLEIRRFTDGKTTCYVAERTSWNPPLSPTIAMVCK
jgi:hypothetical protein